MPFGETSVLARTIQNICTLCGQNAELLMLKQTAYKVSNGLQLLLSDSLYPAADVCRRKFSFAHNDVTMAVKYLTDHLLGPAAVLSVKLQGISSRNIRITDIENNQMNKTNKLCGP
jgi:hypothetical protein